MSGHDRRDRGGCADRSTRSRLADRQIRAGRRRPRRGLRRRGVHAAAPAALVPLRRVRLRARGRRRAPVERAARDPPRDHASGSATTVTFLAIALMDPVDRVISWLDELQVGSTAMARLTGVSYVEDDRVADGRGRPTTSGSRRATSATPTARATTCSTASTSRSPAASAWPSSGRPAPGKSTLGRLLAGVDAPADRRGRGRRRARSWTSTSTTCAGTSRSSPRSTTSSSGPSRTTCASPSPAPRSRSSAPRSTRSTPSSGPTPSRGPRHRARHDGPPALAVPGPAARARAARAGGPAHARPRRGDEPPRPARGPAPRAIAVRGARGAYGRRHRPPAPHRPRRRPRRGRRRRPDHRARHPRRAARDDGEYAALWASWRNDHGGGVVVTSGEQPGARRSTRAPRRAAPSAPSSSTTSSAPAPRRVEPRRHRCAAASTPPPTHRRDVAATLLDAARRPSALDAGRDVARDARARSARDGPRRRRRPRAPPGPRQPAPRRARAARRGAATGALDRVAARRRAQPLPHRGGHRAAFRASSLEAPTVAARGAARGRAAAPGRRVAPRRRCGSPTTTAASRRWARRARRGPLGGVVDRTATLWWLALDEPLDDRGLAPRPVRRAVRRARRAPRGDRGRAPTDPSRPRPGAPWWHRECEECPFAATLPRRARRDRRREPRAVHVRARTRQLLRDHGVATRRGARRARPRPRRGGARDARRAERRRRAGGRVGRSAPARTRSGSCAARASRSRARCCASSPARAARRATRRRRDRLRHGELRQRHVPVGHARDRRGPRRRASRRATAPSPSGASSPSSAEGALFARVLRVARARPCATARAPGAPSGSTASGSTPSAPRCRRAMALGRRRAADPRRARATCCWTALVDLHQRGHEPDPDRGAGGAQGRRGRGGVLVARRRAERRGLDGVVRGGARRATRRAPTRRVRRLLAYNEDDCLRDPGAARLAGGRRARRCRAWRRHAPPTRRLAGRGGARRNPRPCSPRRAPRVATAPPARATGACGTSSCSTCSSRALGVVTTPARRGARRRA